MQKWPLNHTCTVAICSLDATKNQSGIYYLEVIWLDCTLVLYFHSPAARENMAAYSCNIHPYYLLTHQILLVRWLSLGRGGGEPERTCMHCWCFVMAADNSRIFSNELVSKTSYSHFSGHGSYYSYTHARTTCKLHNEVMSWIFGAYECHYAWPLPEANSTTVRDLTVSSVSSLFLSVMVHSRI